MSKTDELPEMTPGMQVDQAMYLELLNILVDQKILTKDQAISRYNIRLKEYPTWDNIDRW